MAEELENIRNNATGQGDDCTNGCLLDYSYFKENYNLIAIDLRKTRCIPKSNTTNYFYVKSTIMFIINWDFLMVE